MTRTSPKPLTGLVLCGGGSSRMGREKALIPVAGRPLVLHVAGLLDLACEPVLLAPGRPGRLGPLGYPEVTDLVADSGPLGGIAAALAASPHPLMAVAAVDLPFASPAVYSLLAELHRGEDAVVPRGDSGPEPLHAVYATSALPALRGAVGRRALSLMAVLSDLRVRWVDRDEWGGADPSGRFAVNLNTADDLKHLEVEPG
jgi:molybdopterin-guanine dinucleotide biosynthesis protein A